MRSAPSHCAALRLHEKIFGMASTGGTTRVQELRQLMRGRGAAREARAAGYASLRNLRIVRDLKMSEPFNKQPVRQVLFSAASLLEGSVTNQGVLKSELAMAALGLGDWGEIGVDYLERLNRLGRRDGGTGKNLQSYVGEIADDLALMLTKLKIDQLLPLEVPLDPSVLNELHADLLWKYKGKAVETYFARRTLRAGADGLHKYVAFMRHPLDHSTKLVEPYPMMNCQAPVVRQQKSGQFEIEFAVTPTKPGDVVEIQYEIRFVALVNDASYLSHLTRIPSRLCHVRVQFDQAMAPEYVNPFDRQLSDFEPPEEREPRSLQVSEGGMVEYSFAQKLHTSFGFGWSWPN